MPAFAIGVGAELPMVCETEKRIRVNNLKNAFFERFVSSQDGG